MTAESAMLFACPRCRCPLDAPGPARLVCPNDGSEFRRDNGIWRFLSDADRARWHGFLDLYSRVRTQEGWRGTSSDLRALPRVPADDPHRAIWDIRRISLRTLLRCTVTPLARRVGRPLRILDLGAGNAWLANQLAAAGHTVAAVDIDDDPHDGLGAVPVYERETIVAVEATFERLPWLDASFDLAVFNGALHYAPDVEVPMAEALRVLDPEGRLVILDSPFYRRASSGEAMVAEREASFRAQHGQDAHSQDGAMTHEGFLTRDRLHAVGRTLGVDWHIRRPWYGVDWALRPLKNRLLRLREPARFLYVEGRPRVAASDLGT